MSRFIKGFGYAIKGVCYAFKTQPNFKFHCAATLIVVVWGCFLTLSTSEWLWVLIAVALVMVSELLNTAIETLVDLVSPEWNAKAGIAKDTAAAAVFIASIVSAIIGLIIFIPKILHVT
jgi:diacylglycerol kinase